MPIRVKANLKPAGDRAPSPHWGPQWRTELPDINYEDPFRDVVKKLSL